MIFLINDEEKTKYFIDFH